MTVLDVSERELTRQVAELAALFGWRRYHTWLAKHSPAGFPDETLVRGDQLVFAELKSERGRLTPAQAEWLEALRQVRTVDVCLWRPSDFDQVAELLR